MAKFQVLRSILTTGAIALLLFAACTDKQEQLNNGPWLLEMEVKKGKYMPVNFQVDGQHPDYQFTLTNADEEILVDEVEVNGDSIRIQMPVFEGYISGVYTAETLEGTFIKESLERYVPVRANHGIESRFTPKSQPGVTVSGIWETVFKEEDGTTFPAKGIFKQDGSALTGTFRTNTGDYRYLEGIVDGDSLKLSTFDGAHVFLFEAGVRADSMHGLFYSGNHYVAEFSAVRNPDFELSEPDSLTFIKPGYEGIEFSFPDEDGEIISLSDERFRDKVVLVQIMGTWCPNCLDESKFLASYLNENPSEDLEVIALAFEYAKTPEAAFKGITRLRNRLGIDYPILLAQYGTSSKAKANEKLPMLNHVLSYPTTLFIDKQGNVRKIHTGFNGPATGEKFVEFKKDFQETVSELLAE